MMPKRTWSKEELSEAVTFKRSKDGKKLFVFYKSTKIGETCFTPQGWVAASSTGERIRRRVNADWETQQIAGGVLLEFHLFPDHFNPY